MNKLLVFGLMGVAILASAPAARAVDYKGKKLDGQTFVCNAVDENTKRSYSVKVLFQKGYDVKVTFDSGKTLLISSVHPTIDDPSHIELVGVYTDSSTAYWTLDCSATMK